MLARRDDVQVVIVGTGSTAPSCNPGFPQRFHRCAVRPELAAAYASMDVFVHPGEHETFCQAVQEAMASGLPVIAPDAGGPRDLVAPYRTGLLLPAREFEARLSQSVDHLLDERARYGVAARRSVLGRTGRPSAINCSATTRPSSTAGPGAAPAPRSSRAPVPRLGA